MADKPRLLILSAVYPFPRNAGQQQRVFYTLKALRENFHLTFLTIAQKKDISKIERELLEICDAALVLPSLYLGHWWRRGFHKVVGTVFTFFLGLKFSNYLIGEVEFSSKRLAPILDSLSFDGVLYEYWHAFKTAPLFRQRGIPTILDMHDILWRSYARQLDARKGLPGWLKKMRINQYRVREESAWRVFDMLIAINHDEYDYARQRVMDGIKIFYVPMGTDIAVWPYCWRPASPPRIAYYGGLGSPHNQQDALLCYQKVMPLIWLEYPDAEFWVVGSDPPDFIKTLTNDKRVCVTGFLEQVQDVLNTMSLVLCPWSGTYGFRSRVIEVMALGIPVVASEDAVFGMGFKIGEGIFLGKTPQEMAQISLKLLSDDNYAKTHSGLGRLQIEKEFSFEATYKKFSKELLSSINRKN